MAVRERLFDISFVSTCWLSSNKNLTDDKIRSSRSRGHVSCPSLIMILSSLKTQVRSQPLQWVRSDRHSPEASSTQESVHLSHPPHDVSLTGVGDSVRTLTNAIASKERTLPGKV